MTRQQPEEPDVQLPPSPREIDELNARIAKMEARIATFEEREQEIRALLSRANSVQGNANDAESISLFVFSGDLDRMISAFVIATGAAAMGTKVHMFFTFWATAALRDPASSSTKKTLLERLFGWFLPKGHKQLKLSRLQMAGSGPPLVRHMMKKTHMASLEEMLELAGELGIRITICTASMNLMGLAPEEFIDYPGLDYCGVAEFVDCSTRSSLSMFI